MTNYLIERVRFARSSLSSSLRSDLINAGDEIVRPLIKLLPSLTSYVVTADILEVIGIIGGKDAFRALSVLLEDAPSGNLPKRLITQSCMRGLVSIGDESSVSELIRCLSFTDPELRLSAAGALVQIANSKPELKEKIILALNIAYQAETFEKPGKIIEDSLEKLGQKVTRRSGWSNKFSRPMVIEPPSSRQLSPVIQPVDKPELNIHPKQTENIVSQQSSVHQPAVQNYSPISSNEYSYLTEEQQKEILEKLLTSPDEEEKLKIIEKLGDSGNVQVIDELLTVVKSSDNKKVKDAGVDAILKIAPNDMKLRFLVLEYILDKRVIGQYDAKIALANALRVAQIGLKRADNNNKPIGSFLFVGPTGVGKTELAKALAEALYGSELQLIRLDMSEYTDLSDKNKLIGSPPGFVGSEEGGRLTQAVLNKPQSVILFDEIEKAHSEIFNLFLQLLDDGRLTDSKGKTAIFRDAIVIMTSNVGSEQILEGINLKLGLDDMKEIIKEVLKTKFKPEFLNRLNENIIFKPLSADELLQVLEIKLKPSAKSLSEKYQLSLEVSDKAKNFIIEHTQKQEFGFSPRELNRIIDDEIVQPLSEMLLDMEISESYKNRVVIPRGGSVIVDLDDSKLCIEIKHKELKEVN